MCQNLTGLSLSISVLLYGRINLSDLKQLRSDRSKGIVLANLSPITRTEQSAATLAATLSAYLRRPQYETALLPHNSDLRPFIKRSFQHIYRSDGICTSKVRSITDMHEGAPDNRFRSPKGQNEVKR